MKRFLLAALCGAGFLLSVNAMASEQQVDCAPGVPCTTGGPSATGTGDPSYVAFGKANADFNEVYADIAALNAELAADPITAGTNITITGTWPNITINSTGGGSAPGGSSGQVQYNTSGALGGISGVTSDGTHLIAGTSDLQIQGTSSGVTSIASANSGATNYTATLPAATDTIVELTQTQTLTNKSIAGSEINSGTIPNAQMPNPGASALGGIESIGATSHEWIASISTSGVPSLTQPATGDISGLGTSATVNTGTSGATIPLLNGTNTWAAAQTFSGANVMGTPASINLSNATSLPCSALPALTGAVTTSAGSCATAAADPTQVTENATYTFVLTDDGKSYIHTDGTARTWTIPANSSVAYNVEACLKVVNYTGAAALTISITTDTMTWVGTGATGSRTITAPGFGVICKEQSTGWFISGANISKLIKVPAPIWLRSLPPASNDDHFALEAAA